MILAVLGTIYFGIATPTEASGIGALGAFLIAAFMRELNVRLVIEILRSTIVTSGMILLILAAALLFGYIMTRLMIPQKVVGLVAELNQRSEEHTSELQSLMRISYAVFCLKTKNKPHKI